MYLIYSLKDNKVIQTNNKPFITYDKNRYQECYIDSLPLKTKNQYYSVCNVRQGIKYLTCDIVVNDRPQVSESVKAELIAKQKDKKYELRVEELIRKRYSLSQELAILRQRNSKSSEFTIYNAYAEECKSQAKKEIYK